MSFFRKQKKRGRPKKKTTKTPKATSPTKTPALPSAPWRKMVRHSSKNKDWTKGEGLLLLTSMISDWDNKEGTLFMSLGPGKVGLNRYCHACEKEWGIGWQTLKAYLHGDLSKRRLPGGRRRRHGRGPAREPREHQRRALRRQAVSERHDGVSEVTESGFCEHALMCATRPVTVVDGPACMHALNKRCFLQHHIVHPAGRLARTGYYF